MTHKMELIADHEGIEEWLCPICGRRLFIEWQPESRKTTVDVGDESAQHSGSKGGLQMGHIRIENVDE